MSSSISIKWDRRALARIGAKGAEKAFIKAGQYLRAKIVKNISLPSSVRPSRPGEYPRADTGRLRQSIFIHKERGPQIMGHPTTELRIGTNLSYGLWHEYVSGRSFLRRTLTEELASGRLQRRFFKGARVTRG